MIEILVALVVFAVVCGGLVSLFRSSSRLQALGDTRIETHQALLATVDALTRDIRLAGACFPSNGEFVSLGGLNTGNQDQLTIRFGNTANQGCIFTALAAGVDALVGGHNLTLASPASAANFAANTAGYITNGSNGNFFRVTAVNGAVLTTDGTWSRLYPALSSTVYAMQEHVYRIDSTTNPTVPALTLKRDCEPQAQIFADGISVLNVQYRKTDNSVVDLPASDAEWRLVKEVLLSVTARSMRALPGGGFHQETASLTVKPRNLQP